MSEFEYIPKMIRWSSAGALSASLALIVFVPGLENVDPEFKRFSIFSFVVAIPFLCTSLYRYAEYDVRELKDEEKSTVHISAGFSGVVFTGAGFAMLLAAIGSEYLVAFSVACFLVPVVEGIERRRRANHNK